jgi:hypothetical protein
LAIPRTPLRFAALLFAVSIFQAPAVPLATLTTFVFRGNCSDCSGQGIATLVLQNYTLGASLTNANFVSLNYSSNLLSFSLSSSDNPGVFGSLPVTLPAAANVSIFANPCCNRQLVTQISGNGFWCAGNSCGDDIGTGAVWAFPSNPGAGPTGVPALTDVTLGCLAIAIAVIGGILLKKRQPV